MDSDYGIIVAELISMTMGRGVMTVDDGVDDKDGSDEEDMCECSDIKLGVNISSGLRAHIQLSVSLAKGNGK